MISLVCLPVLALATSSRWCGTLSAVFHQRGFTRRVKRLRRRLVDDALSALNWLSCKREPCSSVYNQMQDACVAQVDPLACAMLGPGSTDGVPTSAEALSKVL